MINYNLAEEIYNRNFCSEKIYKRGYCNSLVYTEGVMDFQQTLNTYWIIDNVVSYMPKIIKSFKDNEYDFYVVEITIDNDNKGTMEVFTEGYVDDTYDKHISIIKQNIPFIDLPLNPDEAITTYKFYLELSLVTPTIFTLLLPSEH